MDRITSVKNPVVQAMRALKDRKERDAARLMLIEGPKMIGEALSVGLMPRYALIGEDQAERYGTQLRELVASGALVYEVTDNVMEAVCDTRTPQGICAAVSLPVPLDLDHAPDRLVALDGVQDPGNVGTIWRTADAAGFGGLLLAAECADPNSPKVQRAAMGSGLRLPAASCGLLGEALSALQRRGYRVVATALDGDDVYAHPPIGDYLVLVIGGEARGVSADVLALADMRLKLPMRGGAESLNAAVAAGIMMYQVMRDLESARP